MNNRQHQRLNRWMRAQFGVSETYAKPHKHRARIVREMMEEVMGSKVIPRGATVDRKMLEQIIANKNKQIRTLCRLERKLRSESDCYLARSDRYAALLGEIGASGGEYATRCRTALTEPDTKPVAET